MRRARRRSRMETIGRITRAMDRAARDAREGRELGGGGGGGGGGARARGGGEVDDRDPMAARWREVWTRDEARREEGGLTMRAWLETVEINAQCLKARNIFPS
jgi:hypothetical protein